MLQLHAISYQNIGPFAGKTMTVVFQTGKYLIKAPIGSGKSFLFFDGPVYGLYKHASRKMLNSTCATGSIKLWLEMDDVQYLVVRKLKKGKTKDQCSSQLFTLSQTTPLSLEGLSESLLHDTDIQDILAQGNAIFDEVVCKNEGDLQAILNSILPPREVFTSTVLLMQDSPNIFELSPADRITVFKNVFGLLGVDEAKDKIADKKREVQLARKIYADFSRQDVKLNELVQVLINHYRTLSGLALLQGDLSVLQDSFRERETFVGKLSLEGFQLDLAFHEVLNRCKQQLLSEHSHYLQLQHNIQSKKEAYTTESLNHKKLGDTIASLAYTIKNLENTVASTNPEELEELKQKKSSEQQSIASLIHTLPHDILKRYPQVIGLQQIDFSTVENLSFHQWKQLIDTVIKEGKYLAEKKESVTQQRASLHKQKELVNQQISDFSLTPGSKGYERLITSLQNKKQSFLLEQNSVDQQISSLQEHIDQHTKQQSLMQERILSLSQAIDQESIFRCEKIQTDCPYIQMINKKSLSHLAEQRSDLQAQLTIQSELFDAKGYTLQIIHLRSKREELTQSIVACESHDVLNNLLIADELKSLNAEKNVLIDKYKQEDFEQKEKDMLEASQAIDDQMVIYKEFLQETHWKELINSYEQFCVHEKNVISLDRQITTLEDRYKAIEQVKQDLSNKNTEYDLLLNQSTLQNKLLTTLSDEITLLESELHHERYATLTTSLHSFDQFMAAWSKVEELVIDFKQRQKHGLSLAEQEKRLTNLYKIFAKDLLYIVLESSLPTLTEIINSYLAQVVDYTLEMTIKEENEQLSMEAIIEDEKGIRDINSLSGGQKTILKLVWMLAVASYMRSRMLFLDETINNLDADTVASVADMLQDFIKQHTISFYTVTHSQQIQQMAIRDSVITLA